MTVAILAYTVLSSLSSWPSAWNANSVVVVIHLQMVSSSWPSNIPKWQLCQQDVSRMFANVPWPSIWHSELNYCWTLTVSVWINFSVVNFLQNAASWGWQVTPSGCRLFVCSSSAALYCDYLSILLTCIEMLFNNLAFVCWNTLGIARARHWFVCVCVCLLASAGGVDSTCFYFCCYL